MYIFKTQNSLLSCLHQSKCWTNTEFEEQRLTFIRLWMRDSHVTLKNVYKIIKIRRGMKILNLLIVLLKYFLGTECNWVEKYTYLNFHLSQVIHI
jgi:hypothetical protein